MIEEFVVGVVVLIMFACVTALYLGFIGLCGWAFGKGFKSA